MALPPFEDGDLPPGIHGATLRETIARFGTVSPHRMLIAFRLEHIYQLAMATNQVRRFIVFGSFVSEKPDPNDVDIFLLMEDTFDSGLLTGETQLVFDHNGAQDFLGASVFWLRRLSALEGEQAAIEFWQTKRDGDRRGIVEIIKELP